MSNKVSLIPLLLCFEGIFFLLRVIGMLYVKKMKGKQLTLDTFCCFLIDPLVTVSKEIRKKNLGWMLPNIN